MDRHPYVFRADPTNPPSLYNLSAQRLLTRYNQREVINKRLKFKKLDTKAKFDRAKRQLTKYFGLLNDVIKADLMEMLFNYKWDTYRQKHRSIVDKEMLDNNICCTYPEECSGPHSLDLQVPNLELIMLWKILQGRSNASLNMIHFLEQYHNSMMVHEMMITGLLGNYNNSAITGTKEDKSRLGLIRDVERDLVKNSKIVASVQHLQFFGTYRGDNVSNWSTLLPAMTRLQSLELHFWTGETFFDIIADNCLGLKELILYRQRQGRTTKDLERVPHLVDTLADSLRVLIIDSVDVNFPSKVAKELQKAVSKCKFLECLKLEAEESPYVHFLNSRYKIVTKLLLLKIRRSYQYQSIIRNINRCFNSDVDIHLTYDTYVDIDNHKHAYFSQGPIVGGGENTVSQSTRDFEQREVGGNFFKEMSEFGAKVTVLHCETDIRPEYLALLFPNIESLELFSRASRRVEVDARFSKDKSRIWRRLTSITLEVDPGFTASCNEFLLVHTLADVIGFSSNLKKIKILASQSGLNVAEYSLLLELNKVKNNVRELEEVVFLSPYKMHGQGISHQFALWLLENCPKLRLLRDVSSWAGSELEWGRVIREAERRGLVAGLAEKTRKDSLYTIDYDSEGWVQCDTGHKYELFNSLTDEWEVVDVEVEDVNLNLGEVN